jgi:hypothetical protein
MASTPATTRPRRPSPLPALAALALAALACAPALRPLADEDTVAGARALDTSYRVKDRVAVPGPNGREYVLPIGEYRPLHADAEGILYAAPLGVTERAGFSKRTVAGGLEVANEPGRPYERPSLWVDGGDGRIRKLPLPASAVGRYGDALVFAVDGEELVP